VTVLFTDLVGSTELLSRLGETAFDELRRAHFSALRKAIDRHGGEEIKTLGDGILAVFSSAAEAVNIAARTIAGELTAGSILEFTAGDGHRTSLLRFTLGLPGAPEAVSALLADPEARVIPVTWAVVESECPWLRQAS
jgi:class 3 adenylate cyclase